MIIFYYLVRNASDNKERTIITDNFIGEIGDYIFYENAYCTIIDEFTEYLFEEEEEDIEQIYI